MFSFKRIARRITQRDVEAALADLRARRFPEVTPIPMPDWLAQLDARVAAAGTATAATIPDPDPDDVPDGDEDDARRADWEDFDRRR